MTLPRIVGSPTIPASADRAQAKSLVRRFLAKVRPQDGCWEFDGADNGVGYGVIAINRRGAKMLAHRIAYELWVGPIPDGLVIDHLCRNPGCINPLHLDAVTHRTNVLRGNSPAAMQARQTHCKRGHPFDHKNTYTDSKGKRRCRTCHRDRVRRRYRLRHGIDVGSATEWAGDVVVSGEDE